VQNTREQIQDEYRGDRKKVKQHLLDLQNIDHYGWKAGRKRSDRHADPLEAGLAQCYCLPNNLLQVVRRAIAGSASRDPIMSTTSRV
jgi:hypothetical protein